MYGEHIRYHLFVSLITMLLLLMMQLEKLGFIAFRKCLMFLIILRNGKIWFNKTRKKLIFLRSNNRGEYCSNEFDNYCSYHGIHREKRVSGTPQENGVSEIMKREIIECARCMRLRAGFPYNFGKMLWILSFT